MNGNNVNNEEVGVRPALPHKSEIRFKVERIRAEAKESDSFLLVEQKNTSWQEFGRRIKSAFSLYRYGRSVDAIPAANKERSEF